MFRLITNIHYLTIVSVLSVMFSCASNEAKEEDKQNRKNLHQNPTNRNVEHSYSSPMDTVLAYKIIKTDELQCQEWNEPAKDEIIPILNALHEISGTEWHDCYGDWTCGIEGELIYKNEKSYYRIDAAGWIILHNGVEQKFYGCRVDNCWEYFAAERACDEEGVIID